MRGLLARLAGACAAAAGHRAASAAGAGAAAAAAAAGAAAAPLAGLQQQAAAAARLSTAVLSTARAWQPLPQGAAALQRQQQLLHTSAAACAGASGLAAAAAPLKLHHLRPWPGSKKAPKRVGRGDGGGRGTYCGRGVKGQRARKGGGKPHLLFDGGTKTLAKLPKVWVTPSSPVLYRRVGLRKVLRWVKLGLLDPARAITMKELRDTNCASKTIRWGVELTATGNERVGVPLHLQVSSVSPRAKAMVEAAGGSVTRVYYTPLGLRALLKPERWAAKGLPLPRPVRAWPPRDNGLFDEVGQLPPPRELPAAVAAAAVAGGRGGGAHAMAALPAEL